ncbi:MAG: LAGLIDADG family homing endonuclease [Nanoarchaeota archaeon]|nr:LAGLIDADG family homing endonuclease [Nanoarchaeota archaeon]
MRPAYPVNLEINQDLIYLIEALKVEGYWSIKHKEGSIQNKNLPFLRNIERISKNIGLNTTKRILVKIKMPDDLCKENINVFHQNKKLKFHIEMSPFNKNKKKIVFTIPYQKSYELILKINGNIVPIKLYEGEEEFHFNSNIKCWAYLEIRFWNANFIRFLDNHFNKKDLRINFKFLLNKKEFLINALSAIIDSEGSIDYYQHYRRISITMKPKKYIEDLKKLLTILGVHSHIYYDKSNKCSNYKLSFSGWNNFDILLKSGLCLRQSKKYQKLKTIMKTYKRKQISRNKAQKHYVEKLKEINKPIKAKEFSEYLCKSKRVVNHYLTKLMKKGMINVDKTNVAYLYSYKEEFS